MIEESNQEKYQLDSNKWISTLPKKNTHSSIRKYSLTIILFVIGLILVYTIKNDTRNLQKKINNLKASINVHKIDLHQATLDHEVITSPENISRLAKEYLEIDFIFYKKSQIKQLSKKVKILAKPEETKHKKTFNKKNQGTSGKIKLKVVKKIAETKTVLIKFQEFYSEPKKLPGEIKLQVKKNIEKKKTELENLVSAPQDSINLKKLQRWAGIQVVKVLLGLPIVPGR